ncbi:nuclear apoptosis-inducing factor 1-like [Argopecten irradians]|uniref:nuclear apoptosis-inducing factor 1-like n=1 Tax=Argopecten irradians TaxID=31199 RepID=UPI003721D788
MATNIVETPSKKRKPNWTADECLQLTKLVEEKKDVIRAKFGAGVTTQRKREAWQRITDAINASSTVRRSVEEVEKKWHNLHMKGKAELSDHRRQAVMTGGGPSSMPQISPIAEAVGNVIGLDNVSICGIDGAVDTSMMMLLNTDPVFPSISRPPCSTITTEIMSSCAATILPSCTVASPLESDDSTAGIQQLRKQKLQLEIENLKLQNKLLTLKIKRINDNEC